MAKSHIIGIEKPNPKQGGQKDRPLASALAKIWCIRKFEEVGQTPIGMSFLNDGALPWVRFRSGESTSVQAVNFAAQFIFGDAHL